MNQLPIRAYEAAANGVLRVSTEGSDYDTVLAVYTSPAATVDYAKLQEVTCDDNSGADGKTSVVRCSTVGGTKYYLVVDGVNGAKGRVRMRYEFAVAPVLPQGPAWSLFDSAGAQSVGGLTNPPVRLGESVRWAVGVLQPYASAGLTYQWRRNGWNLPGAVNATLVLTNLSVREAGQYSVEVGNFAGATTSLGVRLDLREPVRLLAELAGQTQPAGGTALFTVVPEGAGPFQYRWTWNGTELAGATNAALRLANLTGAHAGEYAVEVRTESGMAASRARLTVAEAPVIVNQPVSQFAIQGGAVQLKVRATGAEPLTYQWRLNGVAIPGATESVLSLENIHSHQAGEYTVVVRNPVQSVISDAAVVTVSQPLPLSHLVLLGADQLQLAVVGPEGQRCLIRASVDLGHWADLTTATIHNGRLEFADSEVRRLPCRFYEAFPLP